MRTHTIPTSKATQYNVTMTYLEDKSDLSLHETLTNHSNNQSSLVTKAKAVKGGNKITNRNAKHRRLVENKR